MLRRIGIPLRVFGLVILLVLGGFAQKSESSLPPKWLQDHMIYMTAGTGRWEADNTKYRTAAEPFDKYVMEYSWGAGKNSIRGRLFVAEPGKADKTFWEYHLFWHPGEQKAVLEHFGSSGIYGVGEMRTLEVDDRIEHTTEMTFFDPDGTSRKNLHRLVEKDGEFEAISFNFSNGIWIQRRRYIWTRVSLPSP